MDQTTKGYSLELASILSPQSLGPIDHKNRDNHRVTLADATVGTELARPFHACTDANDVLNRIPHHPITSSERLRERDHVVLLCIADRARDWRMQAQRLAHYGVEQRECAERCELGLAEGGAGGERR